jgi:hypothetical protein
MLWIFSLSTLPFGSSYGFANRETFYVVSIPGEVHVLFPCKLVAHIFPPWPKCLYLLDVLAAVRV